MSATMEIDPTLKQALKFLHSSNPDSAEKIRLALDEIIKQRYGASKMLVNTLNKKFLAEESVSPGTTAKRRKSDDSQGSSSAKHSSPPTQEISNEPVNTAISIGELKTLDVSEEENLKEFGDLACVVCGAMVLTAGNRLIECADCHSLYHQECHSPNISDDDANEQEYSWCCTNCKNKVMMSKASSSISIPSPSKSSSSHSSSSSSSSSSNSHCNKTNEPSTSKSKSSSSKSGSSTKTYGSSSSAQPSTSGTASSSGNSGSKSTAVPVTPSINIISADRRLQIMKKKAAKQQESKRKHK